LKEFYKYETSRVSKKMVEIDRKGRQVTNHLSENNKRAYAADGRILEVTTRVKEICNSIDYRV
jgi:hypothetical protein